MRSMRPEGLKLQGSCRTCACYVPHAMPVGTGKCYGAPPQMFPAGRPGEGAIGFVNDVPTVPATWVCGQWRRVGNGHEPVDQRAGDADPQGEVEPS